MADVWVSRKKWTCRHCNVTINDDIPSRQHHENGLRHKGNVERALRALYKGNSEKRREEECAQKELQHMERAANKRWHASDVPSVPCSAAPRQKAWNPQDKLAAYTSAASLGVEEKEAEAAYRERFARRKTEARVGEWQTVETVETMETVAEKPEAASAPDAAAPRTDREKAWHFAFRERTVDEMEESADSLPVIAKRRHEVHGEPGELHGRACLETPPRTQDSAPDTLPPAHTDTPAPATFPSSPPSSPHLFKKRKSRSGTAKKVRSGAFA
ncbi:NADPH dehydrogenase [Malassezia vespertilionis]|uniref:U1-type domain-containing protein n=1 Tax=Malassezia vespertilionis TaxID=2020962 RepID=A0A2N1JDR7_9BASI|nr:NADPH dehydrogenase [Malassezia vespertilionis]PKI84700.1 hypothetical protein MVES_001146 [Malassezia vespertilionis]WFD05882.1 NADPH dehydrogenase [Malassezia vespertilionis]